jgi:uncharacterized membrane protein
MPHSKPERNFRNDQRGNTAILFALTIFAMIGFLALSIDVGSFYYEKRKLQGSTDLAALAAAADLANAQNAALATLNQNGFAPTTLLNVEPGVYTADTSIAPTQRFVAQSGPNVNAVRLTTQTTAPMVFGTIFGIGSSHASTPILSNGTSSNNRSVTIGAQAVAAQTSFASFAIGSGVLNIDGGILNSVLGSLIGGNLSLSVADYQNLANTNIDLFSFSNALATRINLTAASYNQVANAKTQLGTALNAVVDTARLTSGVNSSAVAALAQIAAAQNVTNTMSIAPLISFGPYSQNPIGSSPITATLSALDLVSLLAQISNGTFEVQTALDVDIPGIVSATLQLETGQPPVGASTIGMGPAGTMVRTSQTRFLLNVQLAASGQTALVNVPIYFEVAPGTAQLSAVQCTPGDIASSTVTLSVTPALTNAWIGIVSTVNFNDLSAVLTPSPATMFNFSNLASISGYAHASLSNLNPTQVNFSYSEIQQGATKLTSTTDYLAQLVTSLIGNLQVNTTVAGLGFGVPPGLSSLVTTTLVSASNPIDQLLASVLSGLGVNIGTASTWVTGVTCGNSVLVN